MPDIARVPRRQRAKDMVQQAPGQLPCGCPGASQANFAAGEFIARFRQYLPGCTLGRHSHAEARIIMPLQGMFDTRHGRRFIDVACGAALYRPVGDEHTDHYPVPVDCLTLLLPAEDYLRPAREPFAIRDAALNRAASRLRTEMIDPDSSSSLIVEGLGLLVSSIVTHRRPLRDRGTPPWIRTIREQVEANYEQPPTLAELARSVKRDPAYVAATFTRVYGSSVGTYLRQLRLWKARSCLDADPECSLAVVAQRCGFSDQSHFTRHFRRLFQLTPGEYRRRHASGRGLVREDSL